MQRFSSGIHEILTTFKKPAVNELGDLRVGERFGAVKIVAVCDRPFEETRERVNGLLRVGTPGSSVREDSSFMM